jgi:hypothetical protein
LTRIKAQAGFTTEAQRDRESQELKELEEREGLEAVHAYLWSVIGSGGCRTPWVQEGRA